MKPSEYRDKYCSNVKRYVDCIFEEIDRNKGNLTGTIEINEFPHRAIIAEIRRELIARGWYVRSLSQGHTKANIIHYKLSLT